MKSLQNYTIVICPDDNGTVVTYLPAIPGCHAWGQTPDEARAELVCVFEMIKEEYEEQGRSLPNDVELVIANARRQPANYNELLGN
ncbi:type II toxin-antitoxin system HicB family antitoxin [Scytonema sp. UIC 10036]|uniref:type II toxin-antitoxin system HicB family antitoxin n=1 Tax=Scytonema sp. UIC 10036 TaxID=2304196 RepID=UPI0012DAB9EC|nr:type II toxin-antitoxin system HicB family antitoxin [Scytonema sp. UIC 10036]MUG92494.1 type II toxin-antitoxin system HicB family antitoxin [Scytonema sp. UIC 10036]